MKRQLMRRVLPALVFVGGTATAYATEPDWIAFKDPRPLAQAALALSKDYGQPITYEDPPYLFEADRSDVTDAQYARERPGKRAVIPAWRTVTVDRSLWPAVTPIADLAGPLEALIRGHEQTGGALFRLERTGELLHLVPARARNIKGDWADLISVLEAPIAVRSHRTNGANAITTIAEALSSSIGIKVSVGVMPLNVLMPYETDVAADEESARNVLIRVLGGASRPLYWHLYYGPPAGDEPPNYMLNVLSVAPRPAASR